ncbi:MAG TPA: undecaprenyl-diphosphate phosphatase [Bacillota bacterium]|jgi:undecaprenyl-diphosphatase|nr:undecaprenyl-diphosphate phosphatase [Bacillota bacterium]HOL11139.1 undecaprenyl-diphosphate phosphatase [Bacillota bacterium]HPO98860.1 undecaprenyl-diphosphate phosphatase [Bacillota bacterium]
MHDYLIAVLLGIIEGITEFLPISSTGHLILVNEFIGFQGQFADSFAVIIQLGAILSVIVYYYHKLLPFDRNKTPQEQQETWDLWKKTGVGMLPFLIIGATVGKQIQKCLFNPIVVGTALLLGGIALVVLESRNQSKPSKINTISELNYLTALKIGIIQCLAMVPGVSRSAATIIGAMLLGTSRVVAAEFSFFLAIPIMAAASAYSLYKDGIAFSVQQYIVLAIGFIVSFLVAWGVIAAFIKFVSQKNFKPFGYYRIFLGVAVLVYFLTRIN